MSKKCKRWISIVLLLFGGIRCGGHPGDSTGPNDAIEVEKPKAPLILDRRFSDGEAVFRWEDLGNVVGWNIYRAEGAEGLFVKIAHVSSPSFEETGLEYDQTYAYRVAGVAADGTEGTSIQIKGIPRNNSFPVTPRELIVDARNLELMGLPAYIELRWAPNEESDFYTYRVYVSAMVADPSVRSAEVSQEVASPRFVFDNAESGVRYEFKVSAVDKGNLESSPTTVTVEVLSPVVLVSPVEGASTSSQPVLEWNPISGASYEVSVSASPAGIRELWSTEVDDISESEVRYAGPKLGPAGTFWWKVLAKVSHKRTNSVSLSRTESFRVK